MLAFSWKSYYKLHRIVNLPTFIPLLSIVHKRNAESLYRPGDQCTIEGTIDVRSTEPRQWTCKKLFWSMAKLMAKQLLSFFRRHRKILAIMKYLAKLSNKHVLYSQDLELNEPIKRDITLLTKQWLLWYSPRPPQRLKTLLVFVRWIHRADDISRFFCPLKEGEWKLCVTDD